MLEPYSPMRNNDCVSFLAFFRGWKQERSEQLRSDANMEDKREPQSFRRTGEGLLFGTALMVLAACGSSSFLVLSGSVANFIQTDKLPTDYVAEWASGKECRALVAMKDGGPLCRKTFDAPRVYEKPVYCYRTLGSITCYDEPDPYRTSTQRVR